MQPNNNIDVKLAKTMSFMGLANLLMTPIFLIDSRVGLVTCLAVNTFLLQYLHNLGKSRRPGSNALNAVNTFFAPKLNADSYEVNNAFRNIINGGAAVHDELAVALTSKPRM